MLSANPFIWNIIIHCHVVGETECLKIKPTEARKKGEMRLNNKNVVKKIITGEEGEHLFRGWWGETA